MEDSRRKHAFLEHPGASIDEGMGDLVGPEGQVDEGKRLKFDFGSIHCDIWGFWD